ncbi:MAG: type VI secretion system tube protein Hcp [Casimicrobiaceae bacterium]
MSATKPTSAGSKVRRPLLAAALAASAVVPAPAMAAFDIFLKLDNVVGEVTQKGHEKWIELFSYSSGFQGRTSKGDGAGVGKAICSAIAAAKAFDRASPPLITAVMTGQRFQKGQIDFVKVGGDTATTFLKYELQDVIVSSVQDSGAEGGDGTPMEGIALNPGRMTISYYPQTDKGTPGQPVVTSVNCGLPAVQ